MKLTLLFCGVCCIPLGYLIAQRWSDAGFVTLLLGCGLLIAGVVVP